MQFFSTMNILEYFNLMGDNWLPEIENRNWYHECSRDVAVQLLSQVPNSFKKTVFLVRRSTTGEYAISLTASSVITHILIKSTKFVTPEGKELENVEIEEKKFASISDLINFYMDNNLRSYFPNENIYLDLPFREAILPPCSEICDLIEKNNWFVKTNRIVAENILSRLPNSFKKPIFLVRPHETGGFRISLMYNTKIQHFRVEILNYSTNGVEKTSTVCLKDNKQFKNIEELVKYYMRKKLTDVDPQLKTTLGTPYREVLPETISETKALVDYTPTSDAEKSGELCLMKNQKYWIVNKIRPEWFKVYNSDGLIGYACAKYLQLI